MKTETYYTQIPFSISIFLHINTRYWQFLWAETRLFLCPSPSWPFGLEKSVLDVPNLWKRVSRKDVLPRRIFYRWCIVMRNICDLAQHENCHLEVIMSESDSALSHNLVRRVMAYLLVYRQPISQYQVLIYSSSWWRHSGILNQIVWNICDSYISTVTPGAPSPSRSCYLVQVV